MKFKILFITVTLIVFSAISSFSADFKIRALGGIGTTIVTSDFTDLGATAKKTSIGFGVQGLFSLSESSAVGIDAGYLSTWEWTFSTYSANYKYINIGVIYEYTKSIFVIQAGLGVYIDSSTYSANITSSTQGKTGTGLGTIIAAGVDIPITDSISIPILARIDYIAFGTKNTATSGGSTREFGGSTMPLRIMAGVTFNI